MKNIIMKLIGGSWKTALAAIPGFGILITEAGHWANGEPVNWEQVGLAIGLIIAGLFARDNDVTSERAGAK